MLRNGTNFPRRRVPIGDEAQSQQFCDAPRLGAADEEHARWAHYQQGEKEGLFDRDYIDYLERSLREKQKSESTFSAHAASAIGSSMK